MGLGIFNLFIHYLKFYGFRSILSFIDRIIRSIFPNILYKYFCFTLMRNKFFNKKNISFERHSFLENLEILPSNYKKELINVADQIMKYNFNFLGTGKTSWGENYSWDYDIKSNYKWEHKFYSSYSQNDLMPGNGVDIKIPWELNRLHHLVTLAQAYKISNNKKYLNECLGQVKNWQKNNPLCFGINWTSTMEVSIRAVNLIVLLNIIFDSKDCLFKDKKFIIDIIIEHGLFIVNNLEIGICSSGLVAGNHYLANISALFIIGISFKGFNDSKYWVKVGMKSLEDAIKWMVDEEGFYFESSTSYHRFALELFIYPYIFGKSFNLVFSKNYEKKLEKMADIIISLMTPGGIIPQIGDNDNGRLLILNYPTKDDVNNYNYLIETCSLLFGNKYKNKIKKYSYDLLWIQNQKYHDDHASQRIDQKSENLIGDIYSKSGLYILKNDKKSDYMLLRCASENISSLNAHSHNDALNFELWISGKRIIVDPGTFCYSSDPILRNNFRSSFSHNGLIINDKELNEISSSTFGIDWRTKAGCLKFDVKNSKAEMLFEHDSYYNDLDIIVNRSIVYDSNSWMINDKIIGNLAKVDSANCLFIFPPEIKSISKTSLNEYIIDGLAKIKCNNSDTMLISNALFSESYGKISKSFGLKVLLSKKYNFSATIEISRL